VQIIRTFSANNSQSYSEGKRILLEGGETPREDTREVIEYHYALEGFDHREFYVWLVLLAFVWPVVAIAIVEWRKRGLLVLGTRILEPFMLVGSFVIVDSISPVFKSPQSVLGIFTSVPITARAFGAYLAFLSLSVYAIATVWTDIALYLEWRQRKRT